MASHHLEAVGPSCMVMEQDGGSGTSSSIPPKAETPAGIERIAIEIERIAIEIERTAVETFILVFLCGFEGGYGWG